MADWCTRRNKRTDSHSCGIEGAGVTRPLTGRGRTTKTPGGPAASIPTQSPEYSCLPIPQLLWSRESNDTSSVDTGPLWLPGDLGHLEGSPWTTGCQGATSREQEKSHAIIGDFLQRFVPVRKRRFRSVPGTPGALVERLRDHSGRPGDHTIRMLDGTTQHMYKCWSAVGTS